MSRGQTSTVTITFELVQGGPITQSRRAVTVAIARALYGKTVGGRLVWAKGSTGRETSYTVTKVSGHGVEIGAPTAAGDAPVREVPENATT